MESRDRGNVRLTGLSGSPFRARGVDTRPYKTRVVEGSLGRGEVLVALGTGAFPGHTGTGTRPRRNTFIFWCSGENPLSRPGSLFKYRVTPETETSREGTRYSSRPYPGQWRVLQGTPVLPLRVTVYSCTSTPGVRRGSRGAVSLSRTSTSPARLRVPRTLPLPCPTTRSGRTLPPTAPEVRRESNRPGRRQVLRDAPPSRHPSETPPRPTNDSEKFEAPSVQEFGDRGRRGVTDVSSCTGQEKTCPVHRTPHNPLRPSPCAPVTKLVRRLVGLNPGPVCQSWPGHPRRDGSSRPRDLAGFRSRSRGHVTYLGTPYAPTADGGLG